MVQKDSNYQLLPSVFNRLIEEDVPGRNFGRTPTQIRMAIRQDLEDLLNTRQRPISLPTGLDRLVVSLANYGIPDPIGYDLSSSGRIERFREQVENAITRFETRFTKVRVTLAEDSKVPDRILRFRIEASILVHLTPEKMVFSLDVEQRDRKINIRALS